MGDTLLLELDSLATTGTTDEPTRRTGTPLARLIAEIERNPSLLADVGFAGRVSRRVNRRTREEVLATIGVIDDLGAFWDGVVAKLPMPSRDVELAVLRRVEAAGASTLRAIQSSQWLIANPLPLPGFGVPELAVEVERAAKDLDRVRREVTNAIRARTEPLPPELAAQLVEIDRPGRQVTPLSVEEAAEYFRAKRAGL